MHALPKALNTVILFTAISTASLNYSLGHIVQFIFSLFHLSSLFVAQLDT